MWGIIVGSIFAVIAIILGLCGIFYLKKQGKFEDLKMKKFEMNDKGQNAAKKFAEEMMKEHKVVKADNNRYNYFIEYGTFKTAKFTLSILAVLLGAGIIIGMFILFASITSLAQNETALLRNKMNGELTVMDKAGVSVVNPLTEKMTMSLTQQEIQFGHEDKENGTDGYFPITAGSGQTLYIAANIKYQAENTNSIRTLYEKTGTTSASSNLVKSAIKNTITTSSQQFISNKNDDGSEITVLQIKGDTTKLKEFVMKALTEKLSEYGMKLIQFSILDPTPSDEAQKRIDAVTETATKNQIAENERKAELTRAETVGKVAQAKAEADIVAAEAKAKVAVKERETSEIEQATVTQNTFNEILKDTIVQGELIEHGINLNPAKASTITVSGRKITPDRIIAIPADKTIIEQIKEYNENPDNQAHRIDLAGAMTKSKAIGIWDGKLPQTFAGDMSKFLLTLGIQ